MTGPLGVFRLFPRNSLLGGIESTDTRKRCQYCKDVPFVQTGIIKSQKTNKNRSSDGKPGDLPYWMLCWIMIHGNAPRKQKMAAPIYREENTPTCTAMLKELQALLVSILEDGHLADNSNLAAAITDSMKRVRESCCAKVPIKKGAARVGYGVSGPEKQIAVDGMIAILRQIRKQKAW